MATYTLSWSGDADLFEYSEWSAVEIVGDLIPSDAKIQKAYYTMEVRVHLSGASGSTCALGLKNANLDYVDCENVSASSVVTDPSFPSGWRILTYEVSLLDQGYDHNALLLGQSLLMIDYPSTYGIIGGIGDLLSITVVVETSDGVGGNSGVKYYNGSSWVDCSVKYYDGSDWVDCAVNYIESA